MIVDTHAHLTDKSLLADLDGYLAQAAEADVQAILSVSTRADDARRCLELAAQYPQIRAAVGIHPNYCCNADPGDWELITEWSAHPRVAALGETGLDRYWDDCPWDIQVDFFRRHLRLSRETGLPVIIHTRDCAQETLEVLRGEARQGELRGVMHSFTGPAAVADGCLELGLYISFAGMVTFKNAPEIQQIAQQVPTDRLLVETDSPYLTPHPLRGKRPNHPALVAHTLRHIAGLRRQTATELAEQTTANAFRLFGPWP